MELPQNDEIRVEKAQPEHAFKLAQFSNALCEETQGHSINVPRLARGKSRYLSSKYIAKYGGIYLVALNSEDEPVGWANINYELSPIYGGLVILVSCVYVVPEYRRKGVWKQLFWHIFDYAEDKGVKAVKLEVYLDNVKAIKTYESLGMKSVDFCSYFKYC